MVGEPLERLAIELTGPHPTSRSSNVYILTVLDLFTKWAEAIPLRNKEAVTVARALSDVVFPRIGLPIQLLSDNGREFENALMFELCRLLGIEKLRTTAYKASTNGAVERFHRTLNSMLAKVVANNQRDWDEWLPGVMAAYRSSRHEATGFTPNFLMLGREVRAPIDLVYGAPEEEAEHYGSYHGFVDDRIEKMRSAYKLAREHLGHSAERMKDHYDMRVKPSVFKRNTWVFYYNPRRYVGKSPKWQRIYTGPFLVVRMFGRVNAVLQQSKRSRPFVAHVDKLKRCLGPTPVSWLADDGEEIDEEVAEARDGTLRVTGLGKDVNEAAEVRDEMLRVTEIGEDVDESIEAPDEPLQVAEHGENGDETAEAGDETLRLTESGGDVSEAVDVPDISAPLPNDCRKKPLYQTERGRHMGETAEVHESDGGRDENGRPRRRTVRPRYLEDYQ